MPNDLDDKVRIVISILASDDMTEDAIESAVLAEVRDPMLARRLIDWIPEAFGIVTVSHMGRIGIPATFKAKTKQGGWREFPLDVEPILLCALKRAQQMYHDGPRHLFAPLASRSSTMAVVNKALNEGSSLDGAQLGAPRMLGIPAEFYAPVKRSLWGRFFSRTS